MRISVFVFSFGLVFGTCAKAAAQTCTASGSTLTAASCNAADVQACFNAATSSTTQINIPTGTCGWSTEDSFTVPSGNTSLSVTGAGSLTTDGGGDSTVIVDNDSTNNPLIAVNTGAVSDYFRFAGITMEGGSGAVKYNGLLMVSGNSQKMRLDHDTFNSQTYSSPGDGKAVVTTGCVYGVVDHNVFTLYRLANGIDIKDPSCGGDSNGDYNWTLGPEFGTNQFVFIENNTFSSSAADGFANDCVEGGRFAFRFNTFNGSTVQGHATGSAGDQRSCRAVVSYKNTYNVSTTGGATTEAYFLTGGTALVWGNTFPAVSGQTAGYKNLIYVDEDRLNTATYHQSTPPNGWGYCGTQQTGTPSGWDGDTNSSGYPCIDQEGRGKGDLLTGMFPRKCDSTTGCTTYNGTGPHQALEPLYAWDNIWATVTNYNGEYIGSNDPATFEANRDYYTCTTPGTGSCTGFTGASGVGSGTLANRPPACTVGTAYWATDQGNWNQSGSGGQGELFVCSKTNTWSLYYEPYTYPHPLIGSSGSAATAPQPPTGLKATVR